MHIEALAVEMPRVKAHPNRAAFRGVLTRVDVPSERVPSGARGHRVVLTREAAEAALASLIGMALDYTPALDGHDARRKVGIITQAEIKGDELVIAGYLFARDFPELMAEIGRQSLGMSFELANARVENMRAAIWRLTEVMFTGAAILRREAAAYPETSIALEHAMPGMGRAMAHSQLIHHQPVHRTNNAEERKNMNAEQARELVSTAQRMAAAAEALSATIENLNARQEEIQAKIDRIVAAVGQTDEKRAMRERIAQLEEAMQKKDAAPSGGNEMRAGAALRQRAARKTLPPLVNTLLAKNGVEINDEIAVEALDAALKPLSIEQRIAVKAQMARAGIIG